jgi:hypothetical protein
MANRVDTTMEPMKPPGPDPSRDSLGADPDCDQLPTRDDPVLPSSNCSNQLVHPGLGAFCRHLTAESAQPLPVRPRFARPGPTRPAP